MVKYRLFLIVCLIFATCGCAGHRMALNKGQSDIDVSKKFNCPNFRQNLESIQTEISGPQFEWSPHLADGRFPP